MVADKGCSKQTRRRVQRGQPNRRRSVKVKVREAKEGHNRKTADVCILQQIGQKEEKQGDSRESNSGPPLPESGIIPLDHYPA